MPTPGSAGWMDFTRPVWLNPDFKLEFALLGVIRACASGVMPAFPD